MSSSGGGVAAVLNPIALVSTAIAAIPALIEGNQVKQQEKGAMNAIKDQQTALNNQIAGQKKQTQTNLTQQSDQAKGTNAQALAAIRASLAATGQTSGNTILTGPQGASGVPGQGKTLLGL